MATTTGKITRDQAVVRAMRWAIIDYSRREGKGWRNRLIGEWRAGQYLGHTMELVRRRYGEAGIRTLSNKTVRAWINQG